MKNTKTKKLVTCAIMVALATVLSLFTLVEMPLGGKLTPLSMVPIVLISVMYGLKWGFASSFVYSVIQFIFGITIEGLFAWGLTAWSLIGCILLDYIIAYTVIGIAGIFRKKGTVGIIAGSVIALVLRFVSHLLSGVVIFAKYEQFVVFGKEWVGRPWLYSAAYNGFYMLPEIVLTAITIGIIVQIPVVKKTVNTRN